MCVDRAFWRGVVASEYALPEGHAPDDLTRELVGMLGSPDAELRDTFAYPILEHWLHAGVYPDDGVRALMAELAANLTRGLGERDTDSVFLRAFSALMLAEIIHYDNARQFLDADELRHLLELALAYLDAERDQRGWMGGKGWAHAVAHAADILFVLAQSRHLATDDLARILDGIGSKLLAGGAFYVCGEDERLARAADAAIRRGFVPREQLAAWLDRLTGPLTDVDWMDAAAVDQTLDVHHNMRAFVRSVYFALLGTEGGDPPAAPEVVALARDAARRLHW